MYYSSEELIVIGKIVRSSGKDGRLLIALKNAALVDYDLSTIPVFIFFDGLPVPFFIEDSYDKSVNKRVVKLNNIDSIEEAEEVKGCNIYLRKKDYYSIPEIEDMDDAYPDELISWQIINQDNKNVGTIIDIEDIPGNPCLKVKKSKEDNSTFLLPFHESLIIKLEVKNKIIFMNIPEGIVDLN